MSEELWCPRQVSLGNTEIMEAAVVGVMRVVRVIQEHRKDKTKGDPTEMWLKHIEGALGEKAMAKSRNSYWNGVNFNFGTDVGKKTEVRTTKYDNGRLLIQEDDDDEKIYWLLTGYNGQYTIRGWMFGKDCKRDEWLDEPQKGRPCYCVPQNVLNRTYPE